VHRNWFGFCKEWGCDVPDGGADEI
jgi:lipase ATG15